jgi:HD-like signal output (HDOD) protein
LSKPCEPERLLGTLDVAVATRALMDDDCELRSLLGGQENLPKPPGVYRELTDLVARPQTQLADVARVVERDVSTSAEVLKLINSSFFGLSSEVTTIDRAIALLGLEMISGLVLAGNVFSPSAALPDDLDAGSLAERGRRGARKVRLVSDSEGWDGQVGNRLALAALLQEVGLLVLAAHNHDGWLKYVNTPGDTPRRVREVDAFGCTVGRASAYLLGLWGFDQTVVKTLAELPINVHDAPAREASSPAAQAVAYACLSADVDPVSLLDTACGGPGDRGFLTMERLTRWNRLAA